MKIDGRQIAQEILDELKTEIAKKTTSPHLAIVIVGNNPASLSYVKQKIQKAKEIGARTTLVNLDSETKEGELLRVITRLNKDNAINGIIVQKPLPPQIENSKVNLAIDPKKDIDAFSPETKFVSPIGLSVLEVLGRTYGDLNSLETKKITILGKGQTGGEPIRKTLLKLGLKPEVIDSKTNHPEQIILNSDIVISAVGKKEVIRREMLKKDVLLIGAGQHLEEDGQFHGDYNEEEIKDIASFYTPTPGGIGPINVALLLKNLTKA